MAKIKKFTHRFPMLFVIVFASTSYGIMIGISKLLSFMPDSFFCDIFSELVHIAWPILVAILLGYGYICTSKDFGKTFKTGWGYLAFYFLIACMFIVLHAIKPNSHWESFGNIFLGLLTMIGIGIREEILYRGIIVNILSLKYAKTTKGLWLTTIVSSLLFGFVHMFNMFAGVSLGSAFVQSLGATGLGIAFSAIYLRGGNIWFMALTHAIIDFVGLFESTFVVGEISEVDQMNNLSTISPIVQVLAGVIIAFILFRKSKCQEIFDRFDALRADQDC